MAKKNEFKKKPEPEVQPEPTVKEGKNTKKSGAPKKASSVGSGAGGFDRVVKVLKDERTHKVLGLLSMMMSVFFLLAFTSFFFTHTYDDSITIKSWREWNESHNLMGGVGALMSKFFVGKLGLGAYALIPMLFLGGLNALTRKKYISLWKLFFMSFAAFAWTSTLLGYVAWDSKYDVLGGEFGYGSYNLLHDSVGNIGVVIILSFTLITYLIISYNMSFKFLADLADKVQEKSFRKDKTQEDEEEISEITDSRNADDTAVYSIPEDLDENPEIPEDFEFEEKEITSVHTEKMDHLQNLSELALSDNTNTTGIPDLPPTPVPIPEWADSTNVDTTDIPEDVENEFEPEIIEEVDPQEIVFDLSGPAPQPAPQPSGEPEFTVNPTITEETVTEIHPEEDRETDDIPMNQYDPTLDLPHFKFPEPELLADHGSGEIRINKEELEQNKNKIVSTLQNYNIQIDQIKATVGPTVTLYEIVPAPGVRISKIKNLEDDIALSLSALGIRIIAPIPGKGTIGIEVPNQSPEIVSMRSVILSEKFAKTSFDLPIGLGKTISNETFVADLAKMPHLLMAGATGQGKSVGLNAILVSLLYKKHPSQLKFVLVDPKKVELTLFNKIERHYLAKLPNEEDAIITDTKKVVNTLNSLCIEMDNRYELLKEASVRTLKEYNAKFMSRRLNPNKGHRYLPYIVLVVDEFADLIMTAGKEVEMPIARLAQLARAIGIHLIIATQRPSVNIITGTIKANFPARIAFRVTSKIDSRTILDSGGADQLIGRGDMLLSTGSDLIRLQCAFVDTPEVEKLCEFIGDQRGYPGAFELPEYIGDGDERPTDFDINDRDSLFEEAARIIVQTQQGSTSMLQRRLKLGYNRAGRLMDQLEAAGIVGPNEGSKVRQVLYTDEISLNQYLDSLK